MKSLDINKITDNKTFWRTIVPSSTKKKTLKFLMIKNFVEYLTTFFQMLFPVWKYLAFAITFQKKNTFSFNYIFLILKIRNLI